MPVTKYGVLIARLYEVFKTAFQKGMKSDGL